MGVGDHMAPVGHHEAGHGHVVLHLQQVGLRDLVAAGFAPAVGGARRLRLEHAARAGLGDHEAVEVGDTWRLCKLPKGAIPLGGYFACDDIDTGTETLDIDLGIEANGVDSADPDFFVNAGVLSGDAITDFALTNVANYRQIAFKTFTELGAETQVTATANAVANAGGTGTVSCVIYYAID